MNQELLKQRIAYLIEHGGIHRDPLQELERATRRTLMISLVSCAVLLTQAAAAAVLWWHYL